MNDLELIMPIASHGKWKIRLYEMLKYRLLNFGDKKVVVKMLMGPNDFLPDELLKHPSIESYPTPYEDAPRKIFYYYRHLKDFESARWFGRIDDDTVNDISELVDSLDREFDYQDKCYVCGHMQNNLEKNEMKLLRKLGYRKFTDSYKNNFFHEYECAFVSQAAIKEMYQNVESRKIIYGRLKYPRGWGDHCLSYSAYLCKTYPCTAYFLCSHPILENFCQYGGLMAHLHQLANEWHGQVFDFHKFVIDHRDDSRWDEINAQMGEKLHGRKYELNVEGLAHIGPKREIFTFYRDGLVEANVSEWDIPVRRGYWRFCQDENMRMVYDYSNLHFGKSVDISNFEGVRNVREGQCRASMKMI